MNYTLITLWTVADGTYYSNTANYNNYDNAIGSYHNKFKPMQDDTNVASFRLVLIDASGNIVDKCSWSRDSAE